MKNQTSLFLATVVMTCFLMASHGISGNKPCTPCAQEKNWNNGNISSNTVAYSDLPQGSFALILNNESNGKLRDDQIYLQILSQPTGEVTYVSVTSTNVTNALQGIGSLGAVNVGSSNTVLPSFTLADVKNHTLYLPGDGRYYGTRIYVAINSPLTMAVNATADGYAQPNLENPADPNNAIAFDWFEMTYDPTPQSNNPGLNTVAFGGNMTQVDSFSIPMAFTIQGVAGTRHVRGITLGKNSSSGVNRRDELIKKYLNAPEIDTPFKQLAQRVGGRVVRLIAPYHSDIFKTGGAYQGYFDHYINDIWNYYTSNELNAYDQKGNQGNHCVGQVVDGVLTFTRNDNGPFYLSKPTTYDIFVCSGAFQPGGINENALGAQFAAAFNRHVSGNADTWLVPSSYYQGKPANDWSKFWHEVSIDHLAYGFGFDDVASQSSVAILPADESLSSLTLDIGW